MTDEPRHDGLADVINLLAAPIAGGIRTVEQFKRGVDEMFRAIDNLNRTMENLNEAATRVNRLLGEIEEPVRAMMPQLTRSGEERRRDHLDDGGAGARHGAQGRANRRCARISGLPDAAEPDR